MHLIFENPLAAVRSQLWFPSIARVPCVVGMSYGNVFAFDLLGHDSLHLKTALRRIWSCVCFSVQLLPPQVIAYTHRWPWLLFGVAFSHSSPVWKLCLAQPEKTSRNSQNSDMWACRRQAGNWMFEPTSTKQIERATAVCVQHKSIPEIYDTLEPR